MTGGLALVERPRPAAEPSTGLVIRSLSGVQKAALVLMNISTDHAAAVLRNFGDAEAAQITTEMARLRSARGRDAEVAIREFQDRSSKRVDPSAGRSGKQVAKDLISVSFEPDRAAPLLENLSGTGSAGAFSFLEEAHPTAAVPLLADESPETVAFVLVQLPPALAAKILSAHDITRRIDIAQCIATMGTPVPDAAAVVADALRRSTLSAAEEPEGAEGPARARVQPLVDIMNFSEPAAENEMIDALRDRDEALAAEVRAKMLAFEDLPRLQDRDLQQVLRGIDVAQLAVALKGAAPEIADAVRANMSERNREALGEEAAELGRLPKRQVEEARAVVVRAVRELAGSAPLVLKTLNEDGSEAEPEAVVDEEEYVD